MKKNTLTLIIILSVIALLHFVFIYIFFVGNGGSSKTPAVPEPTIVQPSGLPTASKTNNDEPAAVHQKKKLTRETTKFNYSTSLNGKLKNIPEMQDVRNGILIDADTGNVLWSLDPEESVPIASMTKMMTLLVALNKISADNISLEKLVTVSRTAVLVKPSIAGLKPDDQLPLGILLQSMIIKSANDSAQMTAEFFGNGNVEKFIDLMNSTAAGLNMRHSVFYNPHGLPAKTAKTENRSSCEDMAILALALMQNSLAKEWVATRDMTFQEDGPKGPVRFRNHNHLLLSKQCPGVDGIKTGFTQRAGFCIAASCERNGSRLIAVVAGCTTQRARDELVKKLLNWGYKRLNK